MNQTINDFIMSFDAWDSEQTISPQPYDLWTRANVGENMPFPVTPLTLTGFAALFKLDESTQQEAAQGVRRFYGRIYINQGAMFHDLWEKYDIPSSLIDK